MPLVSSSSNEPMSKASAALTSPRGGIKGGGYWKSGRRRVRLPGDWAIGPARYPIKSLLWKTSRCQSLCSTHSSSHNHSTRFTMVPKGDAPSTIQLLEAERLQQGRRGVPHPQTPWGWCWPNQSLDSRSKQAGLVEHQSSSESVHRRVQSRSSTMRKRKTTTLIWGVFLYQREH